MLQVVLGNGVFLRFLPVPDSGFVSKNRVKVQRFADVTECQKSIIWFLAFWLAFLCLISLRKFALAICITFPRLRQAFQSLRISKILGYSRNPAWSEIQFLFDFRRGPFWAAPAAEKEVHGGRILVGGWYGGWRKSTPTRLAGEKAGSPLKISLFFHHSRKPRWARFGQIFWVVKPRRAKIMGYECFWW